MRYCHQIFTLLILVSWLQAAHSDTDSNCLQSGFLKNCGLLHQVVQISTPDGRQTLEQYAAAKKLPVNQVKKLFKATGTINCNGLQGTAQVTGKSNVLTLSGHGFFNQDCKPLNPINCEFTLDDEPGTKAYKLDMSSLKTGPCNMNGSRGDWATVKLTEAVPDILPYDIPTDAEPPRLAKNQPVLQASQKHKNFMDGVKYPKTVEECFVRDVDAHFETPIQTSCNTGKWSSGSAQFITEKSTGNVVIGALNTSEHIDKQAGSGYDSNTLYNSSVELRGDFLKAVRENLK
ncbi:MAG: hypothetical protein ACXVA9_00735 [Bdellovibrionales bacterium]